jgi:Peptidase propeptide and YPEB domain
MRKKTIAGTGATAIVLGGGLVFALTGGGSASAERAAAVQTRPSASASPAATTISRAEAERAALRAVPGGQVRSVEPETEHGTTFWSVRVTKDGVTHDLRVDARTGKVVRDRSGGRGTGHDGAGHREPERRHDRTGAAEQGHDHTRETEHRHGDDDTHGDTHGDAHGRHGGGHPESDDDHGGDRHGEDGHHGHDG